MRRAYRPTLLAIPSVLALLTFYCSSFVRSPATISPQEWEYRDSLWNKSTPTSQYNLSRQDSFLFGCNTWRSLAYYLPEVVQVPFEHGLMGQPAPDPWLHSFLAHGTIPNDTNPIAKPGVDVVATWVDGDDPLFLQQKHFWENLTQFDDKERFIAENVNRHRNWGELRYLVRSVFQFLPSLNTLSIITPSLTRGVGAPQRPDWLASDETCSQNNLHLISQERLVESSQCNPVFSSVTVEAGLYLLPQSNISSDILFYLNDDMMLGNFVSLADIWSPYGGFVFSFDYTFPQLFNETQRPVFGKGEWIFGEWPFLKATSFAMNQRFGNRARPYPRHNGHPLSRDILREIAHTFPRISHLSLAHRWRGEVPAIHIWSAFYWYVIERHREALLFSYLSLKGDRLQDGILEISEKQDLFNELVYINNTVPRPIVRTNLQKYHHYADTLHYDRMQASVPYWSSWDGPLWSSPVSVSPPPIPLSAQFAPNSNFTYQRGDYPMTGQTCSLDFLEQCLSVHQDETVARVMDRNVRAHIGCGDCIINILLRGCGPTGLSKFLPDPPPDNQRHLDADNDKTFRRFYITTSHGKDARPITKRDAAIMAISKYSYSITNLNTGYHHLVDPADTQRVFSEWGKRRPHQLCINDHLDSSKSGVVDQMRVVVNRFFENYFGGPGFASPVELTLPSDPEPLQDQNPVERL